VNSYPNPTGLRARRTSWPSAATCAFLVSGLEILSFVLYLLLRRRAIESGGLTYIGLVIAVFGIAAQATALWGVGRRQQAVAPVSARLGQWAVATYVVVSALLFVFLMTVGGFGVWPAGAVGNWGFQVALIPLTLAFGCLGWASRGGTGPRQRWANGGLFAVATFGVFNVTWTLLGLPTGQRWLWLASLYAALRAATWATVGAWLRSATIVSQSGDSRNGFADQA
jgi:hypothetical protein